MGLIHELRQGIKLGIAARQLFTELREKERDPWVTENPDYPYFYIKGQELKCEDESSGNSRAHYLGKMIGQLMRPRQWYQNAEFLFENPPPWEDL